MLGQAFVAALNHLLRQTPGAQALLQGFAGRSAWLTAGPVDVRFAVDHDGLATLSAGTDADVTLRLDQSALVAGFGDRDALMRGAHVSGNAEFAEALGGVLRNLRWDAAEDLSRYVGDVFAERIVRGAKRMFDWQRDLLVRLTGNVGEYLADERQVLLRPHTTTELTEQLSELRDDLARLEKRLGRLTANGTHPPGP